MKLIKRKLGSELKYLRHGLWYLYLFKLFSTEPKKESKDDSFSTTLVKEFSPVQYDDMAFSGDFSSLLLEPDSRHFSTPTQSQISLPSFKHTANADSMENLEESSTDTGSLIHLDASTQQQIERIKGM